MITVLCIDGNIFLNHIHLLSQPPDEGFETASTLVHTLESA